MAAVMFTPLVLPPFMFAPGPLSPFLAAVPLQARESFVAFMTPVACFRTVESKMHNRIVIAPIGVRRAAVAIVPIIRFSAGRAGKEHKTPEQHSRQQHSSEQRIPD